MIKIKQGLSSDGGSGQDNGGYETEDEGESKALPWHRCFIFNIMILIMMIIIIALVPVVHNHQLDNNITNPKIIEVMTQKIREAYLFQKCS